MKEEKITNGTAVMIFDNENRVLILKRSKGSYWMPERWGLPGGKIEEEEAPIEAAKREVREETELNVFKLMEVSKKPKDCVFFATKAFSGQVKINYEHTSFKWVSVNDLPNYNTTPDLFMYVKEALNELN